MVVLLENLAHRHSVTINADPGAGLPQVMADRAQLHQALTNLMHNGIEAMRTAGGELKIKSQSANRRSAADLGRRHWRGTTTEDTDKVFGAFFTAKSQGIGLGLAISRSIVSSHGGRISATANSERGATFHIALPHTVAVAA